jgi:hypothetical protein
MRLRSSEANPVSSGFATLVGGSKWFGSGNRREEEPIGAWKPRKEDEDDAFTGSWDEDDDASFVPACALAVVSLT